MHYPDTIIETCPNDSLRHPFKILIRAATEAGEIIASRYEKPHDIKMKGEIDLVTEADLAAEKRILSIFQQETPEIPVLSEEANAGYQEIPTGLVWVIDPLDGTTNFAHGFPFFAVSIALCDGDKTLLGVVNCPILDEFFCACQGGGAWLNGKKISASSCLSLNKALVATGFPYNIKQTLEYVLRLFTAMLPKVRDIRRPGAAAIDLAYVACGRLDGFYEMNLKPWDMAAGRLLVEEAGGRISNFQGGSFSPYHDEVVASNGPIHDQLLEVLAMEVKPA